MVIMTFKFHGFYLDRKGVVLIQEETKKVKTVT